MIHFLHIYTCRRVISGLGGSSIFFIFWGNPILFFLVAMPIYISFNSPHSCQHSSALLFLMMWVCSVTQLYVTVTPWTIACQAPFSMQFSRQEYWSGLPFPSPGDLLEPGIKPTSPALVGRFFTTEPPGSPFWWQPPCKCEVNLHFPDNY